MGTNLENKVRYLMEDIVGACLDKRTGEVNTTLLAEMAACEFDLYEGDDDEIPEWVFDLACEFDIMST